MGAPGLRLEAVSVRFQAHTWHFSVQFSRPVIFEDRTGAAQRRALGLDTLRFIVLLYETFSSSACST